MFQVAIQRAKKSAQFTSLACTLALFISTGCGGVEDNFVEENGKAEKTSISGYAIEVERDGDAFSIIATPRNKKKEPVLITRQEDGTLTFEIANAFLSVDADGELDSETIDNPEQLLTDLPEIVAAAHALITEMIEQDQNKPFPFQGIEYNCYDDAEYADMQKSAIALGVGLAIAITFGHILPEATAYLFGETLTSYGTVAAELAALQRTQTVIAGANAWVIESQGAAAAAAYHSTAIAGNAAAIAETGTLLATFQHAPTLISASQTASALLLYAGQGLWMTDVSSLTSDSVEVGTCDSLLCSFYELPLHSDVDAL